MEKQQLMALNARNLQFFAEGGESGGADAGGNDSGLNNEAGNNDAHETDPAFEGPKTQSELDSIINKANQKDFGQFKKRRSSTHSRRDCRKLLKKKKTTHNYLKRNVLKREFEDSKKAFAEEKS